MRDNSISNLFYNIRGCAIISVAYAHSLSLSTPLLCDLSSLMGIIGVPCFLIASGYFYRKQEWKEFLQSKIINIVVPWFIWGSVCYAVSCLAVNNAISIVHYLQYISGYGTWLYYVPVYLVITVIYNFINNRYFLILSLLISFCSCIFTYYYVYNLSIITSYQNPLNWCGFYALGILLKFVRSEKWAKMKISAILVLCILVILITLVIIHFKIDVTYWNPLCFIFELLSFFILVNICSRNQKFYIIESLGKFSFLIYFLHMQFGIFIVNRLLSIFTFSEFFLFCLKPSMVIIVTYILVRIIVYFVEISPIKKYRRYLGIPMK